MPKAAFRARYVQVRLTHKEAACLAELLEWCERASLRDEEAQLMLRHPNRQTARLIADLRMLLEK